MFSCQKKKKFKRVKFHRAPNTKTIPETIFYEEMYVRHINKL